MQWIEREEGAKLGTLALTVEGRVDRTVEVTRGEVASQTWVLVLPWIDLPVIAVCGPYRPLYAAYLTFTPPCIHHPAHARASISVHD